MSSIRLARFSRPISSPTLTSNRWLIRRLSRLYTHHTFTAVASSHLHRRGETSMATLTTPAPAQALTPDELRRMNAYWLACNYLSGGMIFPRDNPLLREPLKPE